MVAAALCAPVPALAAEVKALYDVTFAGIGIAKGTLGVILRGQSYSAKVQISTSGLARIISSEESEATARGSFSGARASPASYELMSRGEKITQVNMSLSGGGVRKLAAHPELSESPDRIPVTNADKRNVVDPLSAVLMPVKKTGDTDGAACNRTLPIFDGWTRYDVKLSYKQTTNVAIEGYSGPAIVCAARWVPVSGHRESRKSTQFMANNRDIEIWLVPVADAPLLVPYKIGVRTMRGMLTVQATRFEGAAGGAVRQAVN
ncbi:DUF3108 domain-containing protein [Methylobrevis albus]|uniref:DUF3108 domain-containing protein n=1 Tax=Methylobrevis albus TaxID=2793297 RepID=A0A931I0Z8_9HYPH|nr:DUF3108 domain-containing protein [Methylobrevis albus]MBH0237288.1 DUF3108 domain-containing protein [Methylobrevis albus]